MLDTAKHSTTMMTSLPEVSDNFTESNATSPPQWTMSAQNPTAFTVAEQIVARYLLPVVIAAGTFGNMTSLAVLLRRRMRRTSVYTYLSVLACADLSVLYLSAFKTWIRLMTDYELMHVSQAACKTLNFLLIVSLNMSAWLIVLTTVDRFVAVWLPLRAVAVCRHRRARLAVIVLLAIVSVFNVHVFWTTELRTITGRRTPMCLSLGGQWFVPLESMKLASYSLVPFIVILVLNCAIVIRLRGGRSAVLRGGAGGLSAASRRTRIESTAVVRGSSSRPEAAVVEVHESTGRIRHSVRSTMHGTAVNGGSGASHQSSAACSQAKVTYMLLAVSITWLALTAPWTLRMFAFPANVRGGEDPRGIKKFVNTLCFLLMYINHAINFYLYCITGRKFRRELVDMMTAAVGSSSS